MRQTNNQLIVRLIRILGDNGYLEYDFNLGGTPLIGIRIHFDDYELIYENEDGDLNIIESNIVSLNLENKLIKILEKLL